MLPVAAAASKHGSTRNLALDGLRGIAVLAVMAYHYWPERVPGGFLGVDLFFVLSGFLITGGLLKNLGAGTMKNLGGFWVRRARRLLPAMLLMLLGATALAALTVQNLPAQLRSQWVGALTYTSNWMQIASGSSYFEHSEPPYFQHLWSLAVEEQFYVIWPVLLAALAVLLRNRETLFGGILMLAMASGLSMFLNYDPTQDTSALYFGTWTHGFGLLLGAAAAVWSARKAAKPAPAATTRPSGGQQWFLVLALTTMFGAFFFMEDTSAAAYQGGMLCFAVLAAVTILALANPHTGIHRLLSLSGIRWIGNRSYGLYLWHWPLLILVKLIFPPEAEAAAVLCSIPLTFLAAVASWRMVEQPILRNGFRETFYSWGLRISGVVRSISSGTTRRYASVLSLCLMLLLPVSAAGVLIASPGQTQLEQELAQAQQMLDDQESTAPLVPTLSDDSAAETGQGEPITHQKKAKHQPASGGNFKGKDVIAIGDSVMLASSQQLLKQLPGIRIDARVGAQVWDAADKLNQLKAAGKLRSVVVIGLGTNGDFQDGTIERIRSVIGPKRELLILTAYAPRNWIDSVNDKYRAAAKTDPHIHIIDWAATAAKVPDLARDRIHPGPQGAAAYAQLVSRTVRGL